MPHHFPAAFAWDDERIACEQPLGPPVWLKDLFFRHARIGRRQHARILSGRRRRIRHQESFVATAHEPSLTQGSTTNSFRLLEMSIILVRREEEFRSLFDPSEIGL